MDDARFAELERRREQNRYFAGLDYAAAHPAPPPKQPRPPKEKAVRDRTKEKARARQKRRDARPVRCVGCGWLLRHKGSVAEYPGTKRHAGKGLCDGCTWRKKNGPPPPRTRHDGTKTCMRCPNRLRSTLVSAEDAPGTVAVGKRVPGGHICRSCQTRELRKGWQRSVKEKPPTHCRGCGHPMRPSGTLLKDHPGTKRHHAHGHCSGCADSERARMYSRQKSVVSKS
jgi:hypothetical protein